MTGIKERRFWDTTQQASYSSAEAGVKLLKEGNIDPNEVDLLIHSAVCRTDSNRQQLLMSTT